MAKTPEIPAAVVPILEDFRKYQLNLSDMVLRHPHTAGQLRQSAALAGKADILLKTLDLYLETNKRSIERNAALDLDRFAYSLFLLRKLTPYAKEPELADFINQSVGKLLTIPHDTVVEFPSVTFAPYAVIAHTRKADLQRYQGNFPVQADNVVDKLAIVGGFERQLREIERLKGYPNAMQERVLAKNAFARSYHTLVQDIYKPKRAVLNGNGLHGV